MWLPFFERLFSLLDPMRGQVAAIWASIITPVAGGVNNRLGAIWVLLTTPATGWGHVQAAVDTTATAVGTMAGGHTLTEVLAAIAALPAGSAIVIPPSSENAEAVWAATYQTTGLTFADLCARAGYYPWALGSGMTWPCYGSPGFRWEGNFVTPRTNPPPNVGAKQPQVDWSLWTPGDDLVAFLQANEAYFNWTADTDGSPIADTLLDIGGGNTLQIRCILTPDRFAGKAVGGAIWPGDALVTKGEPVVMTESAIIDVPAGMDGVLLTVDAVGPRVGNWAVLPFNSYYRAGYVLFLSPEGHAESVQYIGPMDAVYCRQSMSLAVSVVVKLNGASQVTVTPWRLL